MKESLFCDKNLTPKEFYKATAMFMDKNVKIKILISIKKLKYYDNKRLHFTDNQKTPAHH